MATATPAPKPTLRLEDLRSVSEHPLVLAKMAEIARVQDQLDVIDAELNRGFRSEDEITRAETRLLAEQKRPEILRLRNERVRRERELWQQREQAAAEIREQVRLLERDVVKELVPLMLQTRETMCRLQKIEDKAHGLIGIGFAHFDRFSWPALGRSDAGESFVDEWIGRLRESQLIE